MRGRLDALPAPIRDIPSLFIQPVEFIRNYNPAYLRADLVAGVTVAVVLLPQGIAFALIAGLPPSMGIFAGVVGAIVGALWGSSSYSHTGPTSALSLLVLSGLSETLVPGTKGFVLAAGLMAVMAGIVQIVMGMARMGMLVNFVSDAVIVGFAAGAGVQIAVGELRHLFGLEYTSRSLIGQIESFILNLPDTHLATLALGVGTLLLILFLKKVRPSLPGTVIALVVAALTLFIFRLDEAGVRVLSDLPSTLPPPVAVPLFDLNLLSTLAPSALAVAAIGLIQTMAVVRSFAAQTGERLDSNQEFIGQGLANVAAGFFSGFPVSGSFSRSAVNFSAGARTSMAAIFSGVFVMVAMLLLGPLAAYLPRAALSGLLLLVAYSMVDRAEMLRIWRGARGDAVIMLVTFIGTLLLPIQFAVLSGILMSLAYYIMKTSAPRVHEVLPDERFEHLVLRPGKPSCPQLGIMEILGDLYFGAVNHVEEQIRRYKAAHPTQRFLLLRMRGVHHIDISGINMLESVLRIYRREGGDLYMTHVRKPVLKMMMDTGFYVNLGAKHFLADDEAVEYLFYNVLDPAICIYESDVRVFRECQNLPRPDYAVQIILPSEIHLNGASTVTPRELWQRLKASEAPLVVDVREPREWRRGHVPDAILCPMSRLFRSQEALEREIPRTGTVVLVDRGGRRSIRVASALQAKGYTNVLTLEGGMLAWEAEGLLEAVDEF